MPKLVHELPALCHHKASGRAKVRYGQEITQAKSIAQGAGSLRPTHGRSGQAPRATRRARSRRPTGLFYVSELVVLFRKHARQFYVDADGNPTGQHFVIRAALVFVDGEYGSDYVHQFETQEAKRRSKRSGRAGLVVEGHGQP